MHNRIMFLKSSETQYENIFDINNILNSKSVKIDSERVIVNDDNIKYIMSIIDIENNVHLMKFEYVIIGSYNKNTWLWSTESTTLNKHMVKQCAQIKNILNKNKSLTKIINNQYTILTADEFTNMLINIGETMYKQTKDLIYCVEQSTRFDVIIVTKILSNNLF